MSKQWKIAGYYWDGANSYIIYENNNGKTKMILEQKYCG